VYVEKLREGTLSSLFERNLEDWIKYGKLSTDEKGMSLSLEQMGYCLNERKIQGYWYDNWCNALIDIYENMSIGGDEPHQDKIHRKIKKCPTRDVPIERLPTSPIPLQPLYDEIINDSSIIDMETFQKLDRLLASRMNCTIRYWAIVRHIKIRDVSNDVTFSFEGAEVPPPKKKDLGVENGDIYLNKSNPRLEFDYEDAELFYIEFLPNGDGIGRMSYLTTGKFIYARDRASLDGEKNDKLYNELIQKILRIPHENFQFHDISALMYKGAWLEAGRGGVVEGLV
jgi:hypothetical protein